MIKSKKVKIIRYKGLYLTQSFPIRMSSDIGKARNYYPFANIMSFYHRTFDEINCFVVNGISINGDFDSKLEIEMGGIKGWIKKTILKIIRYLEEQQRKLQ